MKLDKDKKDGGRIINWQLHTLSVQKRKVQQLFNQEVKMPQVQVFTGDSEDRGTHTRSSIIINYDVKSGLVETLNTIYTLVGDGGTDRFFDRDLKDSVCSIFY